MECLIDWWGVKFIAENKDDEMHLTELKKKIGNEADSCYEDGAIILSDLSSEDIIDFEKKPHEREHKLCLQISR